MAQEESDTLLLLGELVALCSFCQLERGDNYQVLRTHRTQRVW